MPGKRGNPYKKRLHKDGRLYGKYKVKPNQPISMEDLERALAGERLSSGHMPKFIKKVRDRAYVTLLFWVGPRKLEPAEVKKEDVVIDKTHLYIKIPAFKGGERAGVLKLRRTRAGVPYIIMQWKKTRKGRALFPLSPSTAYRIVTRALGVCPHWLRHNWITRAQKTLKGSPSEVDRKIMAWTGIKRRQTLDSYRMKTEEDIDEIADMEVEA